MHSTSWTSVAPSLQNQASFDHIGANSTCPSQRRSASSWFWLLFALGSDKPPVIHTYEVAPCELCFFSDLRTFLLITYCLRWFCWICSFWSRWMLIAFCSLLLAYLRAMSELNGPTPLVRQSCWTLILVHRWWSWCPDLVHQWQYWSSRKTLGSCRYKCFYFCLVLFVASKSAGKKKMFEMCFCTPSSSVSYSPCCWTIFSGSSSPSDFQIHIFQICLSNLGHYQPSFEGIAPGFFGFEL